VPPYVSAVLLQLFFAITLTRWLGLSHPLLPTSGVYPAGHKGFDLVLRLKHLTLPIVVVAIQIIAVYSRYMRASLLEVVNSDYLRTARAKGISERRILVRHALRNALIPIVTVAAIDIGGIIGGLIITEGIFNIPGVGHALYQAIIRGEGPTVVSIVTVLVIIYIITSLLVDLLYAVLDPRIRLD
ncbi:MAG: ABC transporter permease, partial [Ilumatobacteraceae bacterium]